MKPNTPPVLTPEPQIGMSARGIERAGSEPEDDDDVIELVPRVLTLKTILVPIDFSAASEKALVYAVPLARQFDAKVTLLHVSQVQLCGNEFAYLPIQESAIKDCARHRLDTLAADRIAPGLLGQVLVRYGVAFDEITKAAMELRADMIVINTHGYTGLKHIVLGSTAERVVRYAPCPVLVVREREHEFV